MDENYVVKPLKELFPVCPNCHAMLHRRKPPYSIEELREIIYKHNGITHYAISAEPEINYKSITDEDN